MMILSVLWLAIAAPAPTCDCTRWVQADGGYECKVQVCPLKKP